MSLTLHQHPFASYCWKALIALYEREVPFEPALVETPEDWAALAELYPMSKMPVLIDHDAGVTLPESSPVIEYLDRFGNAPPMVPSNPDIALIARLRDRIFDSYVMTPMQKIVLDNLRPEGEGDAFGVNQAREDLDGSYAYLNDLLTDQWAAGEEFTIADCSAAPSLHYARAVHRWDEGALPGLTAYFERLMARPSVARVVDEARPYREIFPPGWPDYMD
ncbi:MAG: glutathione S-transferase family protein [Solirubrobacterales bacterium]|nr:glutathione S-transferase family protein [Solirubrobacterales bacterium]